jgi:flagellar P-ring protein precursor FlgI
MNTSKYLILFVLLFNTVFSIKISDLGTFNNDRTNFLYGYGLVTGLPGTGDKSKSTQNLTFNLLEPSELGLDNKDFATKNSAIVTLSGLLPSYSKIGDMININVQAMGDAKSIKDGTLLLSYLKGQDQEIYAVCQGQIRTNKVDTTGRIVSGCIIEKELKFDFNNISTHSFKLHTKDLSTALKIKNKINSHFELPIAKAIDKRNITIQKIPNMDNIELLEIVLNLNIEKKKIPSIIINMSTELISVSQNIPVKPITLNTKDFTLTFNNVDKQQGFAADDQNVGNDITLNVNRGLMFRKGKNIFLHDIIRILKILEVSFEEMVNIIKELKNTQHFDAKIIEEY